MENFYRSVICRDHRFDTSERVSDLNLLEPTLRRKVQAVVRDAAGHGVELVVFETYRSRDRQQMLYSQGATRLKLVGVHHYGLACDLVRRVNGHLDWDADYSLLGKLCRAHGLVWGGDWKGFVDSVHVQWVAVRDQPRLFAGAWYPVEE